MHAQSQRIVMHYAKTGIWAGIQRLLDRTVCRPWRVKIAPTDGPLVGSLLGRAWRRSAMARSIIRPHVKSRCAVNIGAHVAVTVNFDRAVIGLHGVRIVARDRRGEKVISRVSAWSKIDGWTAPAIIGLAHACSWSPAVDIASRFGRNTCPTQSFRRGSGRAKHLRWQIYYGRKPPSKLSVAILVPRG